MLIRFEAILSQNSPKMLENMAISRSVSAGKEGEVQQYNTVLQVVVVVVVRTRPSGRSSKLSLCLQGNK